MSPFRIWLHGRPAADAARGDRARAGGNGGCLLRDRRGAYVRGETATVSADDPEINWLAFAAALVGSILIQIGTNLANDYSDAKRGADTADRLGPVRVTSAGLIAPKRVLHATWIAFGLAALTRHLPGDGRRAR